MSAADSDGNGRVAANCLSPPTTLTGLGISNSRRGCTLCAKLAVEDQHRLALRRRVLASRRFGRVGNGKERLVDIGDVGEVDGLVDVSSLELVVEATVDNDELLDARRVDSRLDVVELSAPKGQRELLRRKLEKTLTVAALILINPSSFTPKQGRALPFAS